MKVFLKQTLAIVATAALSACGGGGGGDSSKPANQQSQASFSITDAAVDNAVEVWVTFEAVRLKPQNGQTIEFEFDEPRQIDLLTLQGNSSELLLDNVTLPAGDYSWLRLDIDDNDCEALGPGDSPEGSYIVLDDGSQEALFIPSGDESGLQLTGGFTVAEDGSSNFTIDFDLRKSLVKPVGAPCHFLKPSLRMVDNENAGSIEGTVSAELINHPSCLDDEEGEEFETGNAVYVFAGADVNPDDVDGDDLDDDAQEDEAGDTDEQGGEESDTSPEAQTANSETDSSYGKVVSSALVTLNVETGQYEYVAGFMPAGEYTVAFTCEAELDEPEEEDDLDFLEAATVSVTAGAVTLHDFGMLP